MTTTLDDPRLHSAIATRSEVAHLLSIRPSKLSGWTAGTVDLPPMVHTIRGQGRFTVPLVGIAEAASLEALRAGGMSMQEARRATYFIRERGDEYALASPKFFTDGTDAFIRDNEGLMRLRDRQGAWQEVLANHLRPLVIGPDGLVEAFRVLQFTSADVTVDPRFNAGRMSFVDSRMPVFIIAGALEAGEKIERVADDFGLEPELVAEVDSLRGWLAEVA